METHEKENHVKFQQFERHVKSVVGKRELAEEPMDLTNSCKLPLLGENSVLSAAAENKKLTTFDALARNRNCSMNIAKIMEMRHFMSCSSAPKKRGRKRKNLPDGLSSNDSQFPLNALNRNAGALDNMDYFQNINSKEAEVLKAAKSLFSKRTQTLYHWLYPNTPKAQLKAAVAISWETLGIQEKEFYVSQVLGRFGFPQSSLMVNPQLGGIRSETALPPLDLTLPHTAIMESKNAIDSILMSEPNGSNGWNASRPKINGQKYNRKRGRLGRPIRSKSKKQVKDEGILGQLQSEGNPDEFQDDPELSREFAQFKWSLNFNENEK